MLGKPIVLSLYDYTGAMVLPWFSAGYECWLVASSSPSRERGEMCSYCEHPRGLHPDVKNSTSCLVRSCRCQCFTSALPLSVEPKQEMFSERKMFSPRELDHIVNRTRVETLAAAVQVALDAHQDEEYGHAAFRCYQIAEGIRKLGEPPPPAEEEPTPPSQGEPS